MLNVGAERRRNRKTPGLDISSLIDMVFILLIFFLVNTSFVKETGVTVSRPTAATATVEKKSSILIAIDSEDRIFMEQREIDGRAVRANVERALAENPEAAVIVVADKSSSTGAAITVMDGARLAGASSVSLAAKRPAR